MQIEACQRTAFYTLTNFRAPRINQFHVDERLAGLEEKFRILNNDELADALHLRLEELSKTITSWTPEILSLFLQLSHKPAQRSLTEDLDSLTTESNATRPIWADIVDDVSVDTRDSLWDNVDFAANESEEDYSPLERRLSATSLSSGSNTSDTESKLHDFVIPIKRTKTEDIAAFRVWQVNKDPVAGGRQQSKIMITELQMLRASLSMLYGLPTPVYVHSETGQVLYSRQYSLRAVSESSTTNLLRALADLGTKLSMVRRWLRKPGGLALQQAFQAALAVRIRGIDRELSTLEMRILDRIETITLSSATEGILNASRLMQSVATLLERVDEIDDSDVPFKILELLYEAACLEQSVGDIEGYRYMATLFIECFITYLKPVEFWMERGELSGDDRMFYVSRTEKDIGLDYLWRDQFCLVRATEGLRAPGFLHLSAQKVLNAGKSVDFLTRLGYGAFEVDTTPKCDSSLHFDNILSKEGSENLKPFSELFEVALDSWINQRYQYSSIRLCELLESQCGLQANLDALEYIFFCRNGALTAQALFPIFARLDGAQGTWNDRFVLTEMFRSAFGVLPCIDVRRISVRSRGHSRSQMDHRRSVKALDSFSVHYPLTWPLANVVPPESAVVYQRVLVFLVQVQRAKYVLEQQQTRLPRACATSEVELKIAHSLRHRLLWFTNSIFTYLTASVLSKSTSQMRHDLARAQDVDGMIAIHDAYLVRLEDQCLLSKKLMPIHRAIIALLDLAVSFTDAHTLWTDQTLVSQIGRSTIWSGTHPKFPAHRVHEATSASSRYKEDVLNSNEDSGEPPVGDSTTYLARLRVMHKTYARLHDFVSAGLRGVHRAGSESCWESLADLLAC